MSDEKDPEPGPNQPEVPVDDRPPPAGDAGPPPEQADEPGGRSPGFESIVDKNSRGASRDRLNSQQEALSSFRRAKVTGNAVAGDQHIHYHTGAFSPNGDRIVPLPDEAIEEIEHAFVDPDGFQTLLRETKDRRLVILQGGRGTGRFAAGRRLLHRSCPLFGIGPETALAGLTADRLTPGAGYIRLDLSRAEARALTGLHVSGLIALLEKRNARMVVTVGPTVSFPDTETAEYLHRLGPVRNRIQIVADRLAWRLGEDTADIILDDPEVQELLDRELGGEGPPRHAKTVAVELEKAYDADLPWARTAAGALNQSGEERLKQWFRELPTLSVQCMAVALSVLGGEPYETVTSAAEALRSRLAPPNTVQRTEEDLDRRLTDTRDEWLSLLGARIVPSVVRTRHDAEAPADLVEFIDEQAQEKVLLYFFRAFDRQRPKVLAWLKDLAHHHGESVRFRAGAAAGILTANAYDLVRAEVILPWARSASPWLREVAAFALAMAADELVARTGDEKSREPVRSTVLGWTREPGERLRATAARAWMVEYRAGGREAVVNLLDELGEEENELVVEAVCTSFTELWEVLGEELDAPVLLREWLDSGERRRKTTARLAFLLAAADLIHEVPGETEPVVWPKLLYLYARAPRRAPELAGFWKDVLGAGGLGRVAKTVLAGWVETAETDPLMRRALVSLLMLAADDRTTATRIRHESVKWAKESPFFAQEIRQALARKVRP